MTTTEAAIEFHPLRISRIGRETDDAVSITLDVPESERARFAHQPGQHLIVRAEIDGEDVRRSYSICCPPGGESLQIGIKRIPDGLFSTWATTKLAVGDELECMPPIGEFVSIPSGSGGAARSCVMIAAGSGITPILSMISTTLATEPHSEITLLYGNRTTQSIMFQEELEALKNRYPSRLQVVHVLSREPHLVPLFEGRIDADKLRSMAGSIIDPAVIDDWYLCGPLDMVESLTDTIADMGASPEQIHYELFFDERIETVPEAPADTTGMAETRITLDGRTSVVHVDPDGPPLLDYARTVRAEVPFACKGGMCATCKAVVVSGEVTMDKNYALTQGELDAGYILTCQSHPKNADPLEISYDVHAGIGR